MTLSPKVLKKDIKRLWKTISKEIESDNVPDQNTCNELIKKCEDYTMFAEREWSEQWKQCCHLVKQCVSSAHDSNISQSAELIKEIKAKKKECHKRYKK
jgi:XXXCH domain-containing protein